MGIGAGSQQQARYPVPSTRRLAALFQWQAQLNSHNRMGAKPIIQSLLLLCPISPCLLSSCSLRPGRNVQYHLLVVLLWGWLFEAVLGFSGCV